MKNEKIFVIAAIVIVVLTHCNCITFKGEPVDKPVYYLYYDERGNRITHKCKPADKPIDYDGYICTTSGKPIPNLKVYFDVMSDSAGITDENGYFRFEQPEFRFEKPEIMPEYLKIEFEGKIIIKRRATKELRNRTFLRRTDTIFINPMYLKKSLKDEKISIPSCDEEAELKTKLEAEYQERFWETDFQRTYGKVPDYVLFIAGVYVDNLDFEFSVTRTVTGDAVAYLTDGLSAPLEAPLVLELSIGEWLDFIDALYKIIREQDKIDRENSLRRHASGIYCFHAPEPEKELFIHYLSNRDQQCTGNIGGSAVPSYYFNMKDFKKIINDMAAKIKANGKKSDN